MKKALLIFNILIFVVAGIMIACSDDSSDAGSYTCYGEGNGVDQCWEASNTQANSDGCDAQNRTWSAGKCPDKGYTEECGSVWIRPSQTCWH